MREEYGLEVLERYDIEVKGTRKVRGAFFCDTNEGTMLLRETRISGRRAPFLYHILSRIEAGGELLVDTPVFTKEGELLSTARDGTVYMLKKWYPGWECDIRQEEEVEQAAEKLGLLHRVLGETAAQIHDSGCLQTVRTAGLPGRDPVEEIRRHNRELKKVRAFIRGRTVKNEFEALFLENFEQMFNAAENVLRRMEESSCTELYRESVRKNSLVHGDYNYHNLVMQRENVAITGFEHMHVDIQVQDLYYFIRKAMEKHHWKQKTGQMLLAAYEESRRLLPEEREYIGLYLSYPEKFWKTASTYYHSNKAWLPEKCVEKLQLAVRQAEEKQDFLETVFPAACESRRPRQ